MKQNPSSYDESFRRNFHALMSSVHTVIPGVIEKYDGKRIGNVKPQIQKKLADGTYLELPVIEEVPIIFPGATDFGMTWPLQKGDPVMLHFAERSIEEWLNDGGEAKPEDARRFSLTDAIAIPGMYNLSEPFPESNNEDFMIIYKESSIKILEDEIIELVSNSDINITGAGDINIDGDGAFSITTSDDISLESTGEVEIKNSAGTFTIKSSGQIDLNGNLTVDP